MPCTDRDSGITRNRMSTTAMHGLHQFLKDMEDKGLASVFLVIASPLMFVIAICIKFSSPGPIFYRQTRVSRNGAHFIMLKFRTMHSDRERIPSLVWPNRDAARTTRFGAFLRKASLDELPQFINVLRGDMSIVGPRPERPVLVEQFKDRIPDYMKRLAVNAGITGWAQVNGWRGDTDMRKRIEHDIYYIENWSIGFDFRIILLTLFKGFVHENAY